MAEDELHHQLNGHELEQTPEDSGGQRSLACYNQSMGSRRVGCNQVIEQQWSKGTTETEGIVSKNCYFVDQYQLTEESLLKCIVIITSLGYVSLDMSATEWKHMFVLITCTLSHFIRVQL